MKRSIEDINDEFDEIVEKLKKMKKDIGDLHRENQVLREEIADSNNEDLRNVVHRIEKRKAELKIEQKGNLD